MLYWLKPFGYSSPKLKEYSKDGVEVFNSNNVWTLSVNGERWLIYDYLTHNSAYEIFSHYYLAKGHCICTGLGFGARENWILNKPGVTKLTVIERSKEVIEYHRHIKSPFLDHIELIHGDASEYVGKCDTLLLDHYEFEYLDEYNFLRGIRKIMYNIECNTLWFWPLETLLLNNGIYNLGNPKERYDWYRAKHRLIKLPDLESDEIFQFCYGFLTSNLSQSGIHNKPQQRYVDPNYTGED